MPVLIGLLVSACAAPAPTSTQGRQEIRIFAAPAGSAHFFQQEGIAQAIRKSQPAWDVSVVAGLLMPQATDSLVRGEIDLVMTAILTVYSVRDKGMVFSPEGLLFFMG